MYERAMSPLAIGGMEVKNRIARTAHATMLAQTGKITDAFIHYHLARARGGVGLTILEAAAVHPSSILSLENLSDDVIDGYRALANRIAPYGMRLVQQLWHGGHIYLSPDGSPPRAPSSVPSHVAGIAPVPLEDWEITDIVEAYAAAARRCHKGGLDGVEIHAGHGYLLAQFLSPVLNKRGDRYGGSFDNRARLLFEIMRAVRASVPAGFVVGTRLSDSADPAILPMSDVATIARRLTDERLIDYVNMSYGDYYATHRQVGGMDVGSGHQLPFTAPAVADLSIPRLLNGRFRTLEEVEQALREGQADLISMVRAHIADPEIVAKSLAGHPEQVRPCLACNQGCIGRAATQGRIGCVVNTAAGDEIALAENLITLVDEPRRVLIVGGGPAGLEAARIAALAGHEVILAEAASRLGGLLTVYRHAPKMSTIGDLATWLEQEVYRLGVDVRLSTYVELEDISAIRPHKVILAIGADWKLHLDSVQRPTAAVACGERARIWSTMDLFTARAPISGNTAIVYDDAGHYEGIACSEFLLEQGFAVTYVTRHKSFAPAVDNAVRTQPALERLYSKGKFTLRTAATIDGIDEGGAFVRPHFSEQLERIEGGLVIWIPIRPGNYELLHTLRATGHDAISIGDARSGRNIQTAIREGHLAARHWLCQPASAR